MKLMPSYMTQSRSLTYDLIKVSLLFVKVVFIIHQSELEICSSPKISVSKPNIFLRKKADWLLNLKLLIYEPQGQSVQEDEG